MRNFSYSELASIKMRDQIAEDIEFLINGALDKKLKPFILVVGSLFIEAGSIHSIIEDLSFDNCNASFEDDKNVIVALFKSKVLLVYRDCDTRLGKFGRDSDRGIDVYFDPDEEYISLICIGADKTKESDEKLKTADNYPYYRLKFKEEEILVDFITDEYN